MIALSLRVLMIDEKPPMGKVQWTTSDEQISIEYLILEIAALPVVLYFTKIICMEHQQALWYNR